MVGQSAAQALLLRCLFFLVILSVRAETKKADLRCPDYVANYAPLVWLHSEDPYMPSDLLAHLKHTTPTVQGHAIDGIPSIDLGNLGTLNEFGDEDVALVSKDDPFSYPKWILGEAPDDAGRIHNATPCAVILVEKNEVDLDAFYFYFYSYNEGPNITQVLEPLNRLVTSEKASAGMHFGNHVGDWEHNMVRFRDGKPVGIYYSQHVDGEGYDWNDGAVSKAGDRPIVYSARGSHANYAVPGAPVHNAALVDYCDEGKRWDPVLSAYFYKLDTDTFTLIPLTPPKQQSPRSSSNHTSWFEYKGHWGDFQFPQSDPRQETIPRFGVHRFETGPNGPRFKHLLRKGLVRDQARKMSWTEWAVGIYMYWYPCCIRGWRKWISVGVIITAFAAVVVGIILGVRRLRKPKTVYTKLQAEDIQMDEWRRDEEALLSSSEDEGEDHRHSK